MFRLGRTLKKQAYYYYYFIGSSNFLFIFFQMKKNYLIVERVLQLELINKGVDRGMG